MRIIVAGIGEIGFQLTKLLSRRKGNELVAIEADQDRADEISNQLDALVLNGDGSNPDILEKAQIDAADALIAATGSDQINTVIAMLGRNYGVEKVMVILNEAALRPACQQMGVTAIFSPKVAAAGQMISTLYGFDRINFSLIASGGLKLDVISVPPEKTGRVSDIDTPRGLNLLAIRRDEELMLPYPELELQAQDDLIFLFEEDKEFEKMSESFGNT